LRFWRPRALSRGAAISGLVLYGAIIISFMGDAQWGLAMVRLAISVLPPLSAFGLWFLPATPAMLGLAAVFVAFLLYDIATSRRRVQARHRGGFRRCVST
jgi:hypothetical protein